MARTLKSLRLAGLALALVFLGACSITYNVAGEFENDGQIFYGTVEVSMADEGSIKVATTNGQVVCTGSSTITKQPSIYTLIGGQGSAKAKCNDGRTFKIDFIQTTETGGHGQGLDSNGNVIKLFFDRSETLARTRIKMQRLDAIVK